MATRTAHARLMFRGEVIQEDAIAAVICVESSMTTSAILDGMGNALHSSFADNPDEECILASFTLICFLRFVLFSLILHDLSSKVDRQFRIICILSYIV